MVRIFSHYLPTRLLALFCVEALIMVLAVWVGVSLWLQPQGFSAAPGQMVPETTVLSAGMLVSMSAMGLYQTDAWEDMRATTVRLLGAFLVGLAVTASVIYFIPDLYVTRESLVSAFALGLFGSAVLRAGFYRWSRAPGFRRRVLVLGTGSRIMKLAEYASESPNHEVVGYVSPKSDAQHYVPSERVLVPGHGESLAALAERLGATEIVIGVRERRGGGLPLDQLLECRLRGLAVTELPSFFEREHQQVLIESLNPSWMVLGEGFRQNPRRAAVKRAFDVLASSALLVLTFPIWLVTSVLIRLESRGPVLYRQERVGEGGRPFTIYKFRSMRSDAESDGTPRWAQHGDDRITSVGRVIRKLRIDELPQIINVLKGEMSFVGPRPERPFFVDQLVKQIPYYGIRHTVKPGITGWAQVRYAYGASLDDAVEKLQHDLYYVKNHTLFLDLMILLYTVQVVLWGKGAR